MSNKALGLVLAAILVVGGGYLFTKTQSSEISDPIKIGAIFPLTGANASYGELASKATELAVKAINDRGGIDGRQLKILYEDSQFQSTPALSAYQKLKAQGVKFYLTIGSQVGSTIGPAARNDGYVNFELSAVTPKYRDNSSLTCRAALTADVSSKVLADYFRQKSIKQIATFTTQDEQGVAVETTLLQNIQSFGGGITQKEHYLLTDNDFRSQITKLKAANPDALIIIAPGQHAEPILSQLKELGFTKPIFSNNFTIKNANLKNLALAEGVIFTDYAYEEKEGEGAELVRNFKQDYKKSANIEPPIIAATAYDAISLLDQAFQEEGENPQKVGAFISSVKNFPGVSGKLSFDNDCESNQETVLRIVRQGKFVKYEN